MQDSVFISLIEKSSLIIVLLIAITKIKGFKYIFQKEKYELKDLLIIGTIFSSLAVLGTYNGIDVDGALANTRIIAVVSGGILFGPTVGIFSGTVAGIHRYMIDIGGITAIPCFISTITAGVLAGILNKKVKENYKWFYGIICGIISESITMLLIYLISSPKQLAVQIIEQIYIPMIIGQVSVGFLVSIIQAIQREREEAATYQSKLALDIANKTLPYFRNLNNDSLRQICKIIKDEIKSDAVSITDTKHVLAYEGIGEEEYREKRNKISDITKQVIKYNEILNVKVDENDKESVSERVNLKTAMIIPLTDSKGVSGTLKIYYKENYDMSHSKQALAIGLSQIISTQMEISKIENLKQSRKRAEIKALQTQINPHFLFNALNTITSFIRINPNKARELIINLSTYLRYNLEVSDNMIEISKELEQVKSYVEIEKARFGDSLKVEYDIDSDIDIKIPSLIIQPLVENAIIHGIRKKGGKGTVNIGVKKVEDKVKIWVINDGISIDEEIIEKIYINKMPGNKIGLQNVHLRLKLIYNEGLKIERLNPGTRIEFYVQ